MKYAVKIGILYLCAMLVPLLFTLYEKDNVEELWPQETDLLLAYIDGKPYYYDPVYFFKLADGAMPETATLKDKKVALAWELFYLESAANGKEVTQDWVKWEIKMRKLTVSQWPDVLKEDEEDLARRGSDMDEESVKEIAELQVYVPRYYELRGQCLAAYGGSESSYYRHIVPYIKKYYYISKYTSKRMEEQQELRLKGASSEETEDYIYFELPELVEKYNVEIVDQELWAEVQRINQARTRMKSLG